MEVEEKKNEKEVERNIGNDLVYGQTVQFLHLKSKQYLTVVREIAELQKDCMRICLDLAGGSGSYFYFRPVYKMRIEGDRVRLGDQVHILSRKFNQYIHHSALRFPSNSKFEVNLSTAAVKWKLHQYSKSVYSSTKVFLNVRIRPFIILKRPKQIINKK